MEKKEQNIVIEFGKIDDFPVLRSFGWKPKVGMAIRPWQWIEKREKRYLKNTTYFLKSGYAFV